MRARFNTPASAAEVNRAVCSLRPSITVGGKARKVDFRIDGTPCASAAESDAIRIDVLHRRSVVVLEVAVPTDATKSDRNEMAAGLQDTSRELSRRIEVHTTFAPEKEETRTRHRSNRVLVVSGVLWGSTAAVAIPGVIMLGVGLSNPCCGDIGLTLGGGGLLLFGAAMPFLAAFITTVVGTVMYVNDD